MMTEKWLMKELELINECIGLLNDCIVVDGLYFMLQHKWSSWTVPDFTKYNANTISNYLHGG